MQHALAMFARAAKLDVSKLEAALTWLEQKKLLNCTETHFGTVTPSESSRPQSSNQSLSKISFAVTASLLG